MKKPIRTVAPYKTEWSGKIAIVKTSKVPCGYLIVKAYWRKKHDGFYDWDYGYTDDEKESILVTLDTDFPGVASSFGYVPCHCGFTDGTVDCIHRKASSMIEDARHYLDKMAYSTNVAEDPGYFNDG